MKRYYCPDPETGVLDADESHHAVHVMRQKEGEFCTVFDGKGLEWKVKITEAGKKSVRFAKVGQTRTPKPAHDIVLAQAMPKNKAMDLIIQKATELGIGEIAPLVSDRTVVQPGKEVEGKVEKWRQLTIEAAKQSGNNWLPELHPPRKPRELLDDETRAPVKLIASLQPEAQPLKAVLREAYGEHGRDARTILMIGPEGDFTPAEIGAARAAGFLPVSLGDIVLRSETAAIYTLSAILYELAEV